EAARLSHAGWDPGALTMARRLSRTFDAPLIASGVSRLVYDCNRPPGAESAMPLKSEWIEIPGNRNLTPEHRKQREHTVYWPFHNAVGTLLDERAAAGSLTTLVTIHSFTPVYFGRRRSVEIGILHDTDSRIADHMLRAANRLPNRVVGRNDPYSAVDGVTHSLAVHGIARGLPNVMIEVRSDLLDSLEGEATIAGELAMMLHAALEGNSVPHDAVRQGIASHA
ncbi:MAG: N-formylglutamate amidohydrolase, partial [Pseudomonadota bacterium]